MIILKFTFPIYDIGILLCIRQTLSITLFSPLSVYPDQDEKIKQQLNPPRVGNSSIGTDRLEKFLSIVIPRYTPFSLAEYVVKSREELFQFQYETEFLLYDFSDFLKGSVKLVLITRLNRDFLHVHLGISGVFGQTKKKQNFTITHIFLVTSIYVLQICIIYNILNHYM